MAAKKTTKVKAQVKTPAKAPRSRKPKVRGLVRMLVGARSIVFVNLQKMPTPEEFAAFRAEYPSAQLHSLRQYSETQPTEFGLDGVAGHYVIAVEFADAEACAHALGELFNEPNKPHHQPFTYEMPNNTAWILPGVEKLAEKLVKG